MHTILVTGAGGYIGSHMVKRLIKENYHVVALDNFSRGWREPLRILSKSGRLKIVEGDLLIPGDLSKIFRKHKINAVMHFAALCSVDESVRKPALYFRNNSLGTLNLLEALREAKVEKIIFSSTCAVYGSAKYLPIDEKHPTLPENPYGESKLIAEKIIEWYGKLYGLQYAILRYFNVCGADSEGVIGDSKKPSLLLVQNAVRGALGIAGFSLTCGKVDNPDGTPIRDYIDVEDLVDAHMRAYKRLSKHGGYSGVFNLGNGRGWSVKEIINAVKDELGVDFKIKQGSRRLGEYAKVYANISKARLVLNFKPKKKLSDSIKSLKKWYNNKPNGYKN